METIQEAKDFLFAMENFNKGSTCPCCDQFVKLYRRPIHTTMARMLIKLYHFDKLFHPMEDRFIHVRYIADGISPTGSNDFSKFTFWKMLEEKPKDENDLKGRTSGHWRITEQGKLFVENSLTVTKYVLLYNDTFYGLMGGRISIRDALGRNFDYDKLMEGTL